MKKYILLILMFLPGITYSCNGYVIGFKGLDDIFDQEAFEVYAKHYRYCSKVYSWHEYQTAIKFINNIYVRYHLYGFSKGAESVSYVLKHTKYKKPEYVITLGAYKTANVNFDKYRVKYKNYFDNSGIGQQSPGIYLDVPHIEIQKEVNKLRNY